MGFINTHIVQQRCVTVRGPSAAYRNINNSFLFCKKKETLLFIYIYEQNLYEDYTCDFDFCGWINEKCIHRTRRSKSAGESADVTFESHSTISGYTRVERLIYYRNESIRSRGERNAAVATGII